MAVALLANVRSALIFAGGVTITAALLAASMGSQFTPDSREDYEAEEEAPSERERVSAKTGPSVARAAPSQTEQEFFGDFTGFAEDADLIDDTSGFDPSPQENASVLLEPPPSLDDGDPEEASEPVSAPTQRTRTVRRSARTPDRDPGSSQSAAPRKKLYKIEDIRGFKKAEPR